MDAWKYRHLDNLPPLESNPQPVTRIPSGETRGRNGSSAISQLAYSPSLRNLPDALRPRRSSSVNDMYSQPSASTAFAIQSLKGNKPSAVVKQIRRSSLSSEPPTPTMIPLVRHRSATTERKPMTKRKSSDSIELSTQPPERISSFPKSASLKSLHERSRVIIAPTLSIITDHSEKSLVDPDPPSSVSNLPLQTESDLKKTRIFEYDENDELVEVTDDNGNEDGSDDEELYDEEYIDVVYEDEDGGDYEGGGEGNDDELLHVFQSTTAMEVASHITWM